GPIAATWRQFQLAGSGQTAQFYFFANADTEQSYQATIRIPGKSVAWLSLETGCLLEIPARQVGDDLLVEHTFDARGSLALLTSATPDAFVTTKSQVQTTPTEHQAITLDDAEPWQVTLLDPNALTLDMCDYWFDGQLIAEHEHISTIQHRCLELKRPVDLRMRFTVQVSPDSMPKGALYLAIERPETFTITINGDPVTQHDCGNYRDTSFRKIDISSLLVPGTNEILLNTVFSQQPAVYENLERAKVFESEKNKLTYDCEIEAIYLVGDFGVHTPGSFESLPRHAVRYSGDFLLAAPPQAAPISDLVRNGLPFFNGTIRLTKRLTLDATSAACTRLAFAEPMAHVVKLTINGQDVQEWLWGPFEADITGLLHAGENEIAIELTTGLRNLLGPHHLEEGESYSVGPACFFKEPNIWGCAKWNDNYCFVEFGLKSIKLR
ncbi:MAG TPA: hypothetical protein VHV83_10980, partial [Armatimonadota bacterium]|nr:hypothetical protein [Armatimonadota bacterium]